MNAHLLAARLLHYYARDRDVQLLQRSTVAKVLGLTPDEVDEEIPQIVALMSSGWRWTEKGLRTPQKGLTDDVKAVFAFWQATFGKQRSVLKGARETKIRARLSDGFSVEDIKTAIKGCSESEFHVAGGHIDIELICRDATKLEAFMARASSSGSIAPSTEDELSALIYSGGTRDAIVDALARSSKRAREKWTDIAAKTLCIPARDIRRQLEETS